MEVPTYAKVCGILGLIAAIAGFFVPVVGVLFITPIAIILGTVALYGQYRKMGIIILIINAVNLIISPTFWVNVAAGADIGGPNLVLSWFDLIGVIAMIYFAVKKRKVEVKA